MRAVRARGELADWSGLMALRLGIRPERVLVTTGAISRLVVKLCAAEAVTLGNAILVSADGWRELERKSDRGLVLLAHELAHVEQFRRLGLVRFLLGYGREYLAARSRGRSHRQAYLEISFERQAREVERVARRLLRTGALLRGCEDLRGSRDSPRRYAAR